MKVEEDAFGHILWAYFKGEKSFQIIERDDGYFDLIDTKDYFSTYDDWSNHEKKALEYCRGRVLDVGCGAGRHSVYLQEKGFDVLGIDISPLAIKVCKLRGLKKTKILSIDELNFQVKSFDTIIMMGNTFGLFGNFKKARSLLKKFHGMTTENAFIITTTRDVYKTDNPDHLEYQKANREKGRLSGQLRIRERYHKYVSPWFDYLIVSKEEMKKILNGTGWKVHKFIDSEGTNYTAILQKD